MLLAAVVAAAVPLIKHFEGLRLTAYPDPATHADPWTIGYGATGPDITRGTVWTLAQAEADLARRVETLADQVLTLITRETPTDAVAACVSLAYNIGIHSFAGSTVLRELNRSDTAAAADAFLLWNKAAGHVNPGLVLRRQLEREAFLRGFDVEAASA